MSPSHTLSKRSSSLGRDTFIFWAGPLSGEVKSVILVLGLNQKVTPVSSATLRRWIQLLSPDGRSSFHFRPITVQDITILYKEYVDPGDIIPALSTSPLPAGDYGWFDEMGFAPLAGVHPQESFQALLEMWQARPAPTRARLELYEIPEYIQEIVRLREKCCYVTGAAASMCKVCWVFPPTWGAMITGKPAVPQHVDEHKQFVLPENAILLRNDLEYLYHDNAFSIDVEDHYKIVIFRDLGDTVLSDAAHGAPCTGPHYDYLQHHMRWSLHVHIAGGDVWDEYIPEYIPSLTETVEDEGDKVELSDGRWVSGLGKSMLEAHFEAALAPHI